MPDQAGVDAELEAAGQRLAVPKGQEVQRTAVGCVDDAVGQDRDRLLPGELQRSLFPQHTAEQSAVEVAYRYLPAEPQAGVGGDWYDVIPLSGARVALAAACRGADSDLVANKAGLDVVGLPRAPGSIGPQAAFGLGRTDLPAHLARSFGRPRDVTHWRLRRR
ncbi:hypothetical protein ACWET9_48710 [Streptomyces sp. NPDC004059]